MNLTVVFRSRALVALAITAGLVLCVRGGLGAEGLLCLTPAFVLAATLFGRRYPGERLLAALAGRGRTRRLREQTSRPTPRLRDACAPRGGLLMGFALAVRPPPATLIVS